LGLGTPEVPMLGTPDPDLNALVPIPLSPGAQIGALGLKGAAS
jgi:hypothetical protein